MLREITARRKLRTSCSDSDLAVSMRTRRRAARACAFVLLWVSCVPAQGEDTHLWHTTSETGVVEATWQPRDGRVRIGVFQDWVLTLRTSHGDPVDQVRIGVGGGIPGHGHGLTTQPTATQYLGDGRHLIEGVKLSMAGRWLFAFGIETPRRRDRLLFDIVIEPWSAGEQQVLASLYLEPSTLPPGSPSNQYADNAAAAALGKQVFFDDRFSANGQLSCASCHQPDKFFTDGLPRGVGMGTTMRNTPTIIGAAFLSWYYWDGRRDSLWAQALVPFEADAEMGSNRMAVVRLVGSDPEYLQLYTRAFGPFPNEVLAADLPRSAGPLGSSEDRQAWHRIRPDMTKVINVVFANIGKALAAYERTLPTPQTRFDQYAAAVLAGKTRSAAKILSAEETAGLALFVDAEKTHCLRCHNGPWFTNGGFHNIGTGTFSGENLDFGRVFGVQSVVMDEFNCTGAYSDAEPDDCKELRFLNRSAHVPLDGAFKVPGLRNVAATAPYMHDGRFPDLKSVVEFYRRPHAADVMHELPQLDITDREARQLVAFLESLSLVQGRRPPND